jgi:hypothetical protein
MPQTLDDQLRDCLQCATDCAKRANEVTDLREREDWLSLHTRYLELARGIAHGKARDWSERAAARRGLVT